MGGGAFFSSLVVITSSTNSEMTGHSFQEVYDIPSEILTFQPTYQLNGVGARGDLHLKESYIVGKNDLVASIPFAIFSSSISSFNRAQSAYKQ